MLSGKLLPIRPRPLPEELLSSWIMRLARANQITLSAFTTTLFPDRTIWARDIDKLAPQRILETLAEKTAIPVEHIRQTTLQKYEGVLYRKHNPYGNTRWILPLGKVSWKRYGYGLQCCPMCLASDEAPYLRLSWRLSWYTVCPRHGVVLIDACPRCQQPLAFERGEFGGQRCLVDSAPIYYCDNCQENLTQNTSPGSQDAGILLKRVQMLTQWLCAGVQAQQVTFGGKDVSSLEFFEVFATILNRLVTVKRAQTFLEAAKEASGIQVEVNLGARVGIGFERIRIAQRLRLMGIAAWLIDDWPNRFLQVLRQTNWAPSAFRVEMENSPDWFREVLNQK